ncbi:hypothetical protein [Nesterenkonia rhizosphaerae]|uniref:Uncharacterized protein n=1 Tax=Nesterenkonia rhizosphaerae TaxID=1348272 RepID=A0ABP9G190_9MICC
MSFSIGDYHLAALDVIALLVLVAPLVLSLLAVLAITQVLALLVFLNLYRATAGRHHMPAGEG